MRLSADEWKSIAYRRANHSISFLWALFYDSDLIPCTLHKKSADMIMLDFRNAEPCPSE
jgi:hypothetical protein